MTIPSKDDLINLYRKRAKHYDITANIYYLIGFREWAYRKLAVSALSLTRGDTVVEIGCGTGLNFGLLEEFVGPEGNIIGVDLTDDMIAQAKKRVEENRWANVELVECDAGKYKFPDMADGILSTFAITLIPEYDTVIRNGCDALAPGKRFVILDFKLPSNWLSFLTPLGVLITKPFGVSIEMASRHPWESVNKYLPNSTFRELYGGFAYVVAGEKDIRDCRNKETAVP